MDDTKDKVKVFMKKVNNSFLLYGRVWGSSSSGPTDSIPARPSQPVNPKPLPQKEIDSNRQVNNNMPKSETSSSSISRPTAAATGFDPFDSLITSGNSNKNGYSLNVFECPVFGRAPKRIKQERGEGFFEKWLSFRVCFRSHPPSEEVSTHVSFIGAYVSGKPSDGSVEIVLKLLRNIVKEPQNAKFRRVRMGNPKIREAISEVTGGVELLEGVGFGLREEDGEMWAVMELPSEEQIVGIKTAISLLEPQKVESMPSAAPQTVEPVEPTKVDRQIRVFFSVPESVAAKIELPDSFYNLSLGEAKRDADMRRKKIEESQLLIPKSCKEKLAKTARKRLKKTVIRVQFPDGVVLQGVFSPQEPTSALYEFVSLALKEPSLEFELINPVAIKRQLIPHFPATWERTITLDEQNLVPSALVKFRPLETDSTVFTGLCNKLLESMEPLVLGSAVAPT
ncbi:hypothetical protein Vadar_021694 [Vaccinium darrowii]|uniref:Uncharacterized protein n=1 Tax=Vaccinium darrowii TaxID=229202 RepID=A0ACB7X372_9ERIC|nr:hypothetical protein Vadar_021694 [Vaccinium darrowii]